MDNNAGRELDALIAEKVMGWGRHDWKEHHALERTLYCGNCGTTKGKDALDEIGTFCQQFEWKAELPEYSTRIQDAWQVVEKFDMFDIVWRSPEWAAWVKGEVTYAATAPLAICLAALKAVE